MAVILDGKLFANEICENLKSLLKNNSKKPKLAVIVVGNDAASQIYVKNKQKKAEYIGFDSVVISLPADSTEENILEHIYILNEDDDINGILVQLPLPDNIKQQKIIEAIDPVKDCDGFTSYNFGKLALGYEPYAVPCTPKGIIKLMEHYNIETEGKHAVVIGRSNIVGKPVSIILSQKKNATVTMAHSFTKNLKEITKEADILISAVGKPDFINADFIKEGAVVIDVGINRTNFGITGDIDFKSCFEKASFITPVPGGIGPVTIAMLMENTFNLYNLQRSFSC